MDSKNLPTSKENDSPEGFHAGSEEDKKNPFVLKNNHIRTAKDRWGKLKTTMSTVNHIAARKHRRLDRGDSFLRKFSTRNHIEVDCSPDWEETVNHTVRRTKHRTLKSFVIHPSGGLMFYWLGVVTLAVLYNVWTCIAREAFREIQKGYMAMWFCLDGLTDLIYICDIFVQFRTGYLQQGLMVYETSKLCTNYMRSKSFVVDVMCLLPLDFIQFRIGVHPMIRFPRFLKLYRTMRFMHMYESRTAYPNLLRVASLSHILFLGSHWFAAFYYLISEAEGFEGDWSYPKPEGHYAAVTRKYLASLYWSTLTLTTIGDLPPPDTNWQYAFVIVSYLIGVFIFATIVGQVGNVITNRNASRQEFERLLDGAKFYMQMHNVPPDLQKRVQRWYDYVWTRGRLNCNDINSLGLLPDKLKTELALHVNLGTLKKVTIFQKCRPEFLHDLMLKMRAYIFTPGDLICRRGEVAREMFIIADGVVEILGENSTVLTQMSTGDFFGEIGILNLDGGINRRTADVRSVGYSELFVLSREDVLAALKDHPDAEHIIREYGQRRLRETEEHRKLARSAPSSPDPSNFRPARCTNRIFTESSPTRRNLPRMKYLSKIPKLSPTLMKLFQRRQNNSPIRKQKRNSPGEMPDISYSRLHVININKEPTATECNSEKTNSPKKNLDVIQESTDTSFHENENTTNSDTLGNEKFSNVVLSLLKTKRDGNYTMLNEGNKDSDAHVSNSSRRQEEQAGQPSSQLVLPADKGWKRRHRSLYVRRCTSNGSSSSSSDIKTNKTINHSAPQILLTKDTDATSSDTSSSDSDGDDVFDEKVEPPKTQSLRNHIARKSSPCILSLPATFNQSSVRKFSCPPPLDLPIEVPPFSNFRGISGNTQEISNTLDRFMSQIMRRLDFMESTSKQAQTHLNDTLSHQEKLIKTVYKKLHLKDRGTDDHKVHHVDNSVSEETIHANHHASNTTHCSKDSHLHPPSTFTRNTDLTNHKPEPQVATSQYYEDIADPHTSDKTNIMDKNTLPTLEEPRRKESNVYEELSNVTHELTNQNDGVINIQSENESGNLETDIEILTVTHF